VITRREAVRLLGPASAGAWFAAAQIGLNFSIAPKASAAAAKDDSAPLLAPGAPLSPETIALIEAFKKHPRGQCRLTYLSSGSGTAFFYVHAGDDEAESRAARIAGV
jgi:hypothetical protein